MKISDGDGSAITALALEAGNQIAFFQNPSTQIVDEPKILGLTPEAMEKMTLYDWPGNVRELRNAIDYAFVLCASGGIDVHHLPPKIAGTAMVCPEPPETKADANPQKKEALIQALRQARGNRSEAARILGVSRVTVWKQIKKFEIDVSRDLAQ